jgi:SdiA-regulated
MKLFLSFLTLATSCKFLPAPSPEDKAGLSSKEPESALKIYEKYSLPAIETSGLSWWPRASKVELRQRILAISDKTFKIAIADFSAIDGISNMRDMDIGIQLKSFLEKSGLPNARDSQWEGVTADREGKVFVLEENPGAVYVFDAELKSVLAVFKLLYPPANASSSQVSKRLAHSWKEEENSRGEGILLLSKGHFLILKEKHPVAILEFGPKNDIPVGFSAKTSVSLTEKFELPKAAPTEYVPLAAWTLDKEASSLIEDASELSLSVHGNLLLLSDESQKVFDIGASLDPVQSEISVHQVWKIPKSIMKPEGLVAVDKDSFVIATDSNGEGKNAYWVKP